MQGTIAQILALTACGNAFLNSKRDFNRANFYPGNSTFQFCEFVRFVHLNRKNDSWEETDYAADPLAWCDSLRKDGVRSLQMIYRSSNDERRPGRLGAPDRMLVGFVGGGGRWLIEAETPRGFDLWEAKWELGDNKRADQKIWRVTYGRIATGLSASQSRVFNLDDLRNRLIKNLTALGEFARTHNLSDFANAFDSGIQQLSAQDPRNNMYPKDLPPVGSLPLAAAQLLGASEAAWVFGGMGSWNDLTFQGGDQTKYDELSEELYQLLNAAIVSAANATRDLITE